MQIRCHVVRGPPGGDRLLWVETGPGKDNFAPLDSMTWQVHVYGEPQKGLAEACAELHLLLHQFPWSRKPRQSGLVRNAVYLIRPDGYVALADPDARPERLRDYFRALGIVPRVPSETTAQQEAALDRGGWKRPCPEEKGEVAGDHPGPSGVASQL